MTVETVPATGIGNEFEAARILKCWFEAFAEAGDSVTIVVGARTEGESVEDIDLLVIGEFSAGRQLPNDCLPDELRGSAVTIRDFVFTIEIKAHDPSNIRMVKGNTIEVRYDRWKNATEQANKQKYALKNWIERRLEFGSPRISHAVWLTNAPKASLPCAPRHVLFSDSDLGDLFSLLDASMFERAMQQDRGTALTAIVGRDRGQIGQLRAYFQRKVQLGTVDRRKLDRICERIVREQNYMEKLGQQLLVFRGRGGSGKTLRLLNLMSFLCRDRGARVLFLTYNKALVQDVRRLISVLGFSDKQAQIRTTGSYMLALCEAFGLRPDGAGQSWHENFEARKFDLARMLADGPDISATIPEGKRTDIVDWDFVLIDEGQDWPAAEKSAVISLFGYRKLVIADGVDQFVQSGRHTDWTSGVPTSERQIVTLPKSLRLKANLCRFAIGFAREMGLHDWHIDFDPELGGGSIKIFLRPYGEADHEQLFERHRRAGNASIDSLFCVSTARQHVHRRFPATLQSWGEAVWDGTVEQNRDHFPDDRRQNRVVRYQSCRGLEGWTVVCLDLDCFFEEQIRHAPQADVPDLLIDSVAEARRHAARWCLIPFTRAIDTLVVHASEASEFGQSLIRVGQTYPDFVEIVR